MAIENPNLLSALAAFMAHMGCDRMEMAERLEASEVVDIGGVGARFTVDIGDTSMPERAFAEYLFEYKLDGDNIALMAFEHPNFEGVLLFSTHDNGGDIAPCAHFAGDLHWSATRDGPMAQAYFADKAEALLEHAQHIKATAIAVGRWPRTQG